MPRLLALAEMYARRRDTTHSPICGQLVELGFSVADLSGCGGGVPDALIGKWGLSLLIEFKTPGNIRSKSPTAIAQHEFARTWKGCPVVRATTLSEVLNAFNTMSNWSRSTHVDRTSDPTHL